MTGVFTLFTVMTGLHKIYDDFYISGSICLTFYAGLVTVFVDNRTKNSIEDVKNLTIENYWKLKRELKTKVSNKKRGSK
jgi:hypothetical protein